MTKHTPVLLKEVLEIFKPIKEGLFVDATIGAGGHALAIAKAITKKQDTITKQIQNPNNQTNSKSQILNSEPIHKSRIENLESRLIGLDQDYFALELAAENLKKFSNNITLVHGNFRDIRQIINDLVPKKVHLRNGLFGILADLGMSSMQLDSEDRGFSFKFDAPLDMRMAHAKSKVKSQNDNVIIKNIIYDLSTVNHEQILSAELIIKTWNEAKIADILWRYGEERFSRKIAKAIVQNRKNINSTKDLAEICEKCVPPRYRKHKIHPATKTFQALRIAVNDEIEALKDFLRDAPDLLTPGGRLAIISFHSLEDRLVKQKFNELASTGEFEKITKQVVVASEDEITQNPRARSAKLRVLQKI